MKFRYNKVTILSMKQRKKNILGINIVIILISTLFGWLLFYNYSILFQKPVENFSPPANTANTTKPVTIKNNSNPVVLPLAPAIITHGPRSKKEIALTFDADMNEGMRYQYLSRRVKSWYDERIVRTLIQTKTKATFFLTGMWMELYPKETQAFSLSSLFELANHSYNHPSFDGYCYGLRQIADVEDKDQVLKTQKILKDLTGLDNHYFRFPGGCYSPHDLEIVHSLGLDVVHWDVVSGDAFNNNAKVIEKNVINQTQNGSIIIMHLNGAPNAPKTAEALPVIIDALKKKGFTFVKVSEMLEK